MLFGLSATRQQQSRLLVRIRFIYSFIPDISIAPLQVHYSSEVLPTQQRYCVGINTPERYGQLRVKDLPKLPNWRRKAPNLALSHPALPMATSALFFKFSLLGQIQTTNGINPACVGHPLSVCFTYPTSSGLVTSFTVRSVSQFLFSVLYSFGSSPYGILSPFVTSPPPR